MTKAPIGTFAVSARASEVAAFRRAARLSGADDRLPPTYPIRWLALPEVRATLMSLVAEPDLVPFHESQSFDYARLLSIDVGYTLAVSARRDHAPERLVVAATVTASDGAIAATFETVLRLFPARSAA